MRPWIVAWVLVLAAAQPHAALPLALLGKEIVKSIVQSLVEDAVHSALIATLGPCDGALASGALSSAQALVGSRGAVPGLPGGMPALPAGAPIGVTQVGGPGVAAAGGALGAAAGGAGLAIPGGPSMDGLAKGLDPLAQQMRKLLDEDSKERLREIRADQKRRGLTPEQIEAEDRKMIKEELETGEQMLAMVRDSRPLSAAELDEFVGHYARFAKFSPDAPKCSPESLRRLLSLTTVVPMTAGPIRTMLASLRGIDKEMADARRTFAAMTPADRAEFAREMAEQIEDWGDDERREFAGLLRSGALGLPAELRDELLRRLD